jgi:DNA polymerase-4
MGIRTCGELGRAPLAELTARFGVTGKRLRDMGRGIDRAPVASQEEQEAEESRSIGHSMTLEQDCGDREQIERHILQLSEKVGRRMRRSGYFGRTVSLTLRYADFTTFSRRQTLRRSVRHGLDIYGAVVALFRRIGLEQPIRLVGVIVSGLERNGEQVPLFPAERRQAFLSGAMDAINDRYGDQTVTWATLALAARHERVISPAWRPGGAREY